MNFLTNINLNGNELQNVVIQNLAQDPTSLKQGQFWYNSSTHQLKYAALVEEEIKAVVIGEGEVTDEELANLAEKITALESTVNGTEEITGLVEEVATLKETVNGTEGQPSLSEQIREANKNASDALTEAGNAKTEAEKSATAASASAQSAIDSATAAGLSAEAAQKSATDASSSASAASKSQEAAENAQSKADAAEKNAIDAQAAAEAAQAAAEAVQADVDSKVEKVVGPVNNIVVFDADGAIKDGGKTIQQAIDEAIAAGAGEGESIDLTGYVQKVEEATEGNIVLFTGDGSIIDNGYSIASEVVFEEASKIPTSNAVASYIDSLLATLNKGINFIGVIDSPDTIATPYNAGDIYYISKAGTYFGNVCSVGDILIATVDRSSEEIPTMGDWSALEGNKDVFVGSTTDSPGTIGLVPAPSAGGELRYLDSQGNWTPVVATRYSATNEVLTPVSGTATWGIIHNLGRMDVQVSVYSIINNNKYEQVMCSVELIGTNACNIKINSDIEIPAGSYYVVVM